MIFGGLSLVFACIMKETYTPVLLRQKADRIRKQTDDSRWWCRYDQKEAVWDVMKVSFSRPFVMAVSEPIWWGSLLLFWFFACLSARDFAAACEESIYFHHAD